VQVILNVATCTQYVIHKLTYQRIRQAVAVWWEQCHCRGSPNTCSNPCAR